MDNPPTGQSAHDALALMGRQMAAVQRVAGEKLYNQQQKAVVSAAAINLGQAMGLPPERLALLSVASQYYNAGKDPVRNPLWLKPGPLNPDEQQEMQNYPLTSANQMIAASVEKRAQGQEVEAEQLERAIPIVLTHKYNYNGSGFPGQAIAGDQIPMEAQILGMVDAYYAMISQRPYRPAMAPTEALQTLQSEAGTKWNPALVESFVRKTQ